MPPRKLGDTFYRVTWGPADDRHHLDFDSRAEADQLVNTLHGKNLSWNLIKVRIGEIETWLDTSKPKQRT